MTQTTTGWVLFVAAISMMFGLMAVDVSNLSEWRLAFSPGFVGSAMAHMSVVGMAFVGGKLIPQERDTSMRSRSSDNGPQNVIVVKNEPAAQPEEKQP